VRDPVKLQVHDPVTFSILGPFQVQLDDHAVPIKATKQRALLAALVLNANRPVSVEELADLLWDGCSPPGARGTVQAYVMRLRGVLGGPGRRMLKTVAGGYQLAIPPETVDLNRFERLTDQGERSAAAGQLVTASSEFSQALSLWRGPALADVDSELLRRTEVPRLDEQRMLATERRIELDLVLGRHRQVISEVRELVSRYPLRERYWYLLIQALHRSGWRADALAAYRSGREVITRELGVEPGDALRELHQVVLNGVHDRGGRDDAGAAGQARGAGGRVGRGSGLANGSPAGPFSAAPGPSGRSADGSGRSDPGRSDPGSAGPGSGVADPALPGRAAPGLAGWVGQCQLPMEVPGFVGRATDTGEIAAVLTSREGVPVVVVSGPPGVGKTALAVRVAHRIRGEFPDGQLYVPLTTTRGVREPSRVLASLLAATGLSGRAIPADRPALVAAFRAWLADRRVLLVLDCARDGHQVRPLLPGTAGCAVLVTSHSELRSLRALSGARGHALGPLPAAQARRLLALIIGEHRVDAEPGAADRIAALCGHLPLALRIAAAHLAGRPGQPLRDYAAELDSDQILDKLAIGGDRAAAVRTAFARCYDALDPGLRRCFVTLAARWPSTEGGAAGEITAGGAASVLGVPAGEAAEQLDGLAEHGVLLPGGQGRYRFAHPLRTFGVEIGAGQAGGAGRSAAAGQSAAAGPSCGVADSSGGQVYP
jgi:DNA-binding SARP family transcriptional activator